MKSMLIKNIYIQCKCAADEFLTYLFIYTSLYINMQLMALDYIHVIWRITLLEILFA